LRIPNGESTNWQSWETGNIGYTRRRKNNTIQYGHHYTQTSTTNVNKIW
jgi:hypothetical protein